MTQDTPAIVHFEAIYTFAADVPVVDAETGEPLMSSQTFSLLQVPVVDGQVSEASVLFAVLSDINAVERAQLAKVSLAFYVNPGEGSALMPWLDHKDSPLYEGKLWLRQHALTAA